MEWLPDNSFCVIIQEKLWRIRFVCVCFLVITNWKFILYPYMMEFNFQENLVCIHCCIKNVD